MKRFFIIAGEASGDYIGGRLIEDIKSILRANGDEIAEFIGIGGQYMRTAGLNSVFSIDELSIIGIWEVIGSVFRIKKLINRTVDEIFSYKPDVIITIDSSGFTHRVDKAVKKRIRESSRSSSPLPDIPIVHYVAPPVWAWRSWRAKSMRKFIDKLLTLFPFEPDFFTKYQLKAIFVGHPIAIDEDFCEPLASEKKMFLQSMSINKEQSAKILSRISSSISIDADPIDNDDCNGKIITLLPGSRKSEINYHMPVLEEFTDLITKKYAKVKFIIPTTEYLASYIGEKIKNWGQNPIIVTKKSDKVLAYYTSNLAVATSGTVTLELARIKLPCVVIYKTSKITSFIVKRLIKIDRVSLINILAGKEVVPELLQSECTARNILEKSVELLETDAFYRQKRAFTDIIQILKPEKPDMAAREVLKMIY